MSDRQYVLTYLRKAKNDLEEAQVLLAAGHPDGTCNRAYYTLFDALLALLHTKDGPIPRTHTGAHTEFRKQFIQTDLFDRAHSSTITELFNLRQGGDYDVYFDISLDDAKAAVEKAAEFLLQVEVYLRVNKFIA